MLKRFYEKDGNLDRLKGRTIAIIGYGSQGHAHALNLRDSGLDVVVGLYPGSKSWQKAEAAGLKGHDHGRCGEGRRHGHDPGVGPHPGGSVQQRDRAAHDTGQDADVRARIQHPLRLHQAVRRTSTSRWSRPRLRVTAFAKYYTEGMGVPALVAVHQNATGEALEKALAYAKGLGCLKAGVIETNFKEETESDLFGEQAVLCGGVSGADPRRLRNAGRSRLRAGDRLLRVPARAEADRRPDL